MNKLINYIYIGSEKRLGQLKLFKEENFEKVTKLNFSNERDIGDLLDSEIADFEGNKKFTDMISQIKKISTIVTKTPNTDQGIYLSRELYFCLLYTSPSPRDVEESRMPSSA